MRSLLPPARRALSVFVLAALAIPTAAAAAGSNYRWLPPVQWTDGPVIDAVTPLPAFEGMPAEAGIGIVPGSATGGGRFAVDAQEAAKPPEPPHTGFSALVRMTGADFAAFPQRKSTWVILAIGGAAAAAVHPLDDNVVDSLQGSSAKKVFAPGRVIGYAWTQAGLAIGLYVIGRTVYKPEEGKTNKLSHLGFDLLRANILTQALTYGVKYAVRRDRPTGECCSFPSGHASVTFATASVLERHFGYRGAWPTFVVAGYVAASRLFDNRHFLSDVVFGSALGIASGWTVVGRHGRDQFAMIPYPTRGGMGVSVQWRPHTPATEAGSPQ